MQTNEWQGPVRYSGSTRAESDAGAPGFGLAAPMFAIADEMEEYHDACEADGWKDGLNCDLREVLCFDNIDDYLAEFDINVVAEQHDVTECIPEIAATMWMRGFRAGVIARLKKES
jgi:hypothetical protein